MRKHERAETNLIEELLACSLRCDIVDFTSFNCVHAYLLQNHDTHTKKIIQESKMILPVKKKKMEKKGGARSRMESDKSRRT